MSTYAQRLIKAMEDADVGVAALASRMQISPQAVHKILRGDSASFSLANNSRAAEILHINPTWLASGEGAMRGTIQAAMFEPSTSINPVAEALHILHGAMRVASDKRRAEVQKLLEIYLGDPERHHNLLKILEHWLSDPTDDT